MCHHLLSCATFHRTLLELDRRRAEQTRAAGCPYCDGVLHAAHYPRKPRGVPRALLGVGYERRFSFCCALCRRRTTPPSLRFLGRRVYLGAVVVLICAATGGLADSARAGLVETLELPAQTLHRWRRWWTQALPLTPCWRVLAGRFSPPPLASALPGSLLGQVVGDVLDVRLSRLLVLLAPLTIGAGAPSPMLGAFPQRM